MVTVGPPLAPAEGERAGPPSEIYNVVTPKTWLPWPPHYRPPRGRAWSPWALLSPAEGERAGPPSEIYKLHVCHAHVQKRNMCCTCVLRKSSFLCLLILGCYR